MAVLLTLTAFAPRNSNAQTAGCPVAPDACSFALQLQRWLNHGDAQAIADLLLLEEVECPGPAPRGLGGPYPLCDDSAPGERRAGAHIVRLASEGGMGSRDYFRDGLLSQVQAISSGGMSRLAISMLGCADTAVTALSCSDGFSVIFAAPPCAPDIERCNRPVLALPVQRVGNVMRLTTIISTNTLLFPPAAFSQPAPGLGLEQLHHALVGHPPFFAWAPAASYLPPAGTGPVVDTHRVTVSVVFAGVLAVTGCGVLLWLHVRRRARA